MRSLALILLSVTLLGCAVALGPGFNHTDRIVSVSAISIEPTRITVRVADKLENIGNRGLAYLDVSLPAGSSLGTQNLGITVAGKTVASRKVNAGSGSLLRIPFNPSWPIGGEREIAFRYELEPSPDARGAVAANPDDFYLADPNVFPSWRVPLGPFARGSLRAQTERLEITVPADFRVLAVGRERRSERRGELIIHRFEMVGAEFPPYVIAGRYQEQRLNTEGGEVVFWTRESLDGRVARRAAQRLTASAAVYEESFGRIERRRSPIYVVETSAELAPIAVETPDIPAASFPKGVLFDRRGVAAGLAIDSVLNVADYELAQTWFGWHVRPEPEADLLLGRGMAFFAALHAAEARGGKALRQEEIARLIQTYDGLGSAADEKPGFGPPFGYNRAELTAKAYKGALFLLSLEDIAGEEKFHRAVRRILTDMAGQEIGTNELRSAVEAEAGRNLAEVFHTWIDHPGLPADFRKRYSVAR
jgi:Peptidase family M1 domain